jgi:glycosyltransferase involved in cell wall biosynthesis
MIAPALPPQLNGIGDYCAQVAAWLAKARCCVAVYTAADTTPGALPGVEIYPNFTPTEARSVENLVAPIVARRPDWVLLQYNPFSYGKRGWNPYLPGVMARIKRESPGTRVAVMAHETFVPPESLKFRVMRAYQQDQFRRLGREADLMLLSIEGWAREFQGWFPRIPVLHLPVGSNMAVASILREEARERLGIRPGAVVVGLFGQAHPSRMLDWVGAAVQAARRERPDTVLLYVGPHETEVRRFSGDVPVIGGGPFAPEEVSRRFAAMDIHLTPFLDGASTRRTSLMTGLQHGIATVSTRGGHTDSVLAQEDGSALFLPPVGDQKQFDQIVLDLLRDPALRERVGRAGQRLYAEQFDWPRICGNLLDAFAAAGPEGAREVRGSC